MEGCRRGLRRGCYKHGLYGFGHLKEVIEEASHASTLAVSEVNSLITLTVADGWEVLMTDGLLSLLGLDDRLGVAR